MINLSLANKLSLNSTRPTSINWEKNMLSLSCMSRQPLGYTPFVGKPLMTPQKPYTSLTMANLLQ